MKVFHCDHCGHLLFFENTQCVRCGKLVAYLPDLGLVGSLDEDCLSTGVNPPGCDNDRESDTSTGAAYVFVRNQGVWSQ